MDPRDFFDSVLVCGARVPHIAEAKSNRLVRGGVLREALSKQNTPFAKLLSLSKNTPRNQMSPAFPQVIPEGVGPVKTDLCVGFACSASFLVMVGRVEVGVGVKARAEPDRVAAVGP
jgi:hypothetical protein